MNELERVSIHDSYSVNYGYPPYEVDPVTGNQIRPEDKDLRVPTSIVVCRSKKCAPALSNMSSEFLYNAYYNLLENNVGTNVMMCSADSTSHVCYEPFVSFDANAGVAPATVVIDSFKIVDLGMIRGNQAMTPVIDYSVYTNGIKTKCSPAVAVAKVKSPNYMVIDGMDSECRFTSTGKSVMSMVLTVDYIDFDYGIIGASYSVGSSGTTSGGSKGYTLLRFKNPVTGDLIKETCDKDKNACERKFDAKVPDSRFVSRCVGGVSTVYPYAPCSSVESVEPSSKKKFVAPTPVSASEGKTADVNVRVNADADVSGIEVSPASSVTVYRSERIVTRQNGSANAAESSNSVAEDESVFDDWNDSKKDAARMKYAVPFEYDVIPYVDSPRFSKEGRAIMYDDFANRKGPAGMVVISPVPRTSAK